MVKQRRATRRDAMAAKKGNSRYDQQKRNFKLIITAVGIATCVVIGIYFSFSAPEAGTTREVRSDDDAWHEMKNNWSVRPLSPKQSNLITEAIDVERLKNEYLRNFMVVRVPGSKNIKKVEKFVTTTLENLGYEIELDTFKDSPPKSYSQKRVSFTNIVATHDPYARRRLVLACHYDSKVTPVGFLGATDSAVPCAMLLEIAKSLEPYMVKGTDLTLQLIFFDGEEAFVTWTAQDSIYGSRHLAQTWQSQNWPPGSNGDKNRLHSIDLFVLLDLLGEKDPSFYDIRNIHKSGHYKDIVRIEKNLQDGLVYFNQKSVSYYVEDDHIPFHKRDVPILHIIPKPFPANWHKITDDGTNIHDPTVERLTKILAVFSAEYLHLEPSAS